MTKKKAQEYSDDELIDICIKCKLHPEAKQPVMGEGPKDAKVMLIGQNPGKEEDRTAKPFVGRAGKLLNSILEKKEIRRDELFITSVVKCWTQGNKKPSKEQTRVCLPLLVKQIKEIKPKIIVLMGATSKETPRLPGIIYLETVHPAAGLRYKKFRNMFKEDMEKLKRLKDEMKI
jgi:DNA polymerase